MTINIFTLAFVFSLSLFADKNCQSDYLSVSETIMKCEQNMLKLQSRFDATCSGARLESHVASLLEKEKNKSVQEESSSSKTYKTKLFLWTYARSEQQWLLDYEKKLISKKDYITEAIQNFYKLNEDCQLTQKESRELLHQIEELLQYYDSLKNNIAYVNHCNKIIQDIEMQYRNGL